jgi:hypothetical protein
VRREKLDGEGVGRARERTVRWLGHGRTVWADGPSAAGAGHDMDGPTSWARWRSSSGRRRRVRERERERENEGRGVSSGEGRGRELSRLFIGRERCQGEREGTVGGKWGRERGKRLGGFRWLGRRAGADAEEPGTGRPGSGRGLGARRNTRGAGACKAAAAREEEEREERERRGLGRAHLAVREGRGMGGRGGWAANGTDRLGFSFLFKNINKYIFK